MDASEFRTLALALPEVEEKSHFGKADFRVRNKILASLADPLNAVLKLTPEQQAVMVAAEPDLFQPVKGGWGRMGWTRLALLDADAATARGALATAWRNVATPALQQRVGGALGSRAGRGPARGRR